MGMAFSDIMEKANAFRANLKFFAEQYDMPGLDLYALCLQEIDFKLEKLNGNNNKKILGENFKGEKFDKTAWQMKYASTCRHLVRMSWFCEYMEHLFNALIVKPDESLSVVGREAYDAKLGPHHPWIVRKGA